MFPVMDFAAIEQTGGEKKMKRKRMNDLVGLMVATDGSCVIP